MNAAASLEHPVFGDVLRAGVVFRGHASRGLIEACRTEWRHRHLSAFRGIYAAASLKLRKRGCDAGTFHRDLPRMNAAASLRPESVVRQFRQSVSDLPRHEC